MPVNRLIDSKTTAFFPDDLPDEDGILLHKYMQSSSDTLRQRLAIHEYLKVDGGEIELMGRAPNRFQFEIVYTGIKTDNDPGWRRRYASLAAKLDAHPKGVLNHPVFGAMRVVVEAIDAARIDVVGQLNTIRIPITFVENAINTNYEPENAKSTAAKLSVLDEVIENLSLAVAKFTAAAEMIEQFVASVEEMAASLTEASNTSTPDPALETQLGAVSTNADLAIEAIEADPANEGNADAFDAVSSVEVAADACTQAYEALAASRPVLVTYIVPADTNLLALASVLYGNDAASRVEEILTINHIPDPYRILAGTVLKVSQPIARPTG